MTSAAHPSRPPDRLINQDGRTFRVEAGCSVIGALDLDSEHVLLVLARRRTHRGADTWPRAVTLRVFQRSGDLWIARQASVTVPATGIPALISVLERARQ